MSTPEKRPKREIPGAPLKARKAKGRGESALHGHEDLDLLQVRGADVAVPRSLNAAFEGVLCENAKAHKQKEKDKSKK